VKVRSAVAGLLAGGVLVAVAAAPAAPAAPTAPTARAAPAVHQVSQPVPPGEVRAGRELFQVACSSCHGLDGEGTGRGPTLVGVGAASADFYLSSGRMPLDRSDVQSQRKDPAYTPREIRQLVGYVASLGPGPAIPEVDPEAGELVEGYELYSNNCASCHSAAGAGGALGPGALRDLPP
jgi:ubiquinol-cytochrome c reductase cytochrome c subunit